MPLAWRVSSLVLLAGCAQHPTLAQAPVTTRSMTSEQGRVLAAVKAYVDSYIRNLPDYICLQTTKRDFEAASGSGWPVGDEVRELVRFVGSRENYEVLSVNGKRVHMEHAQLAGGMSTGEFGTWLQRIFDPASETEFGYQRRTTLRGVAVDVFTYSVTSAHGYTIYSGPPAQQYVSAWEGLVYADHASGAVVRITMACTGIPARFPVQNLNLTLDYSRVKIGEREYVLPLRFELRQQSFRGVTHRLANFSAYRKFETDATFSAEAQEP